jgi:predicted nucleotidyltransferase
MSEGMNRQQILDRLRENERALRERGVSHAALFGSRARGDDRPDSDIDIMIEIAPDFPMDVFQYVGVVHAIEDLFPLPVDVSNLTVQKPHVRPSAQRDAVYAF